MRPLHPIPTRTHTRTAQTPLLAGQGTETAAGNGRPSSALTTIDDKFSGDVEAPLAGGPKEGSSASADGGEGGKKRSVLLSVCSFILLTEFCERLSYFGLAGSLVLLFQSRLGLSNSEVRSFVLFFFFFLVSVRQQQGHPQNGSNTPTHLRTHLSSTTKITHHRPTTSTRCGPASATARP
jgi:hypothetical protein